MTQGRVLVNLSGGIDSAHCLDLVLSEGRDVVVHHIRLRNWEGRQHFEEQATKKVLDYLRAKHPQRRITYLETGFDYGNVRYIVYDLHVWSFFTAVVLANPQHKDVREVVISSHLDSPFMTDVAREQRRRDLVKAVIDWEPTWLFPIGKITKAEVIRQADPQLLKRCWYCRRPAGGKPCGKCHTCKQVRPVLREVGVLA